MYKTKLSQLHWLDRNNRKLDSAAFDVACLKMEGIVAEFGGDRKGTKLDTINEGLAKAANPALAQTLLGQRFMLSATAKPLFVTYLPVDALEQIQLPANIDAELTGTTAPTSVTTSALASAFGNKAAQVPAVGNDARLVYAAKLFFSQIAAYLRLVHADQRDDIFTFEVAATPCSGDDVGVATTILNSGESKAGDLRQDSISVTFGMQKKVA